MKIVFILPVLTWISAYAYARSSEKPEPEWYATHHAAMTAITVIVFNRFVDLCKSKDSK